MSDWTPTYKRYRNRYYDGWAIANLRYDGETIVVERTSDGGMADRQPGSLQPHLQHPRRRRMGRAIHRTRRAKGVADMIDANTIAMIRDQFATYATQDITPSEALGLALATAVTPTELLTAIATALDDLDLPYLAHSIREARDGNDWSTLP